MPRLDALAPDFHRLPDDAAVQLHRTVVPQQFVNGRIHKRGVIPQPLQLLRVAQQGQGSVADKVAGSLVAGRQHQHQVY